ncbi:OB-fold domain-containing protein [uncultured Pseudacidovorax sp.]|uniref:Zn-ribbon domain-containing OB-fold protein n=1 Tax=uncultured Pseudacidovorax sp. TaxID=679313 RepID=UPI0025E299E6|nr:OB-fold domain-containing protein [uncultured Pseudacidovorax sp.]
MMTATPTLPHPQEEYFAHLAQGRFMIQRSRSSGTYVFYPRVVEPRTGSTDLEWVAASGRGTVYATTVMRARPPAPSYNVCLVTLEEGPRMMSRVEGVEPQAVRVGMRVHARIAKGEGGQPLVVFDPAPENSS